MVDRLHRVELTTSFLERLDSIESFLVEAESTVYLLSIRHHRQLSFDFVGLWPGATGPTER